MENNELLEHFTSVVEELNSKLDTILGDYKKAQDEFDENQKSKAWEEKFGEKLKPYADKMKALNGDDFDILSESRKEYEAEYGDFSDDEYVDALVKNIDEALNGLKEALADGDVAEAAHAAEEVKEVAENAAEQIDEQAHEEIKEEQPAEEHNEEHNEEEQPAEEENAEAEDELAAFTADLEADKDEFDRIEEAKRKEREE